jgi:hypothetical protein
MVGPFDASTFLTVIWLILIPALRIAAAISRNDRPRSFIRRICRIAACCSGTAINPPASSWRQPNGARPFGARPALWRAGRPDLGQDRLNGGEASSASICTRHSRSFMSHLGRQRRRQRSW